MTAVTTPQGTGRAAGGGPTRRPFSSWLSRHAGARLAGLLSAPMLWLVVAYLGALGVLLVSSFWTIDDFTGQTVHQFSLANFKEIFTTEVYRSVTLRSVLQRSALPAVDGLNLEQRPGLATVLAERDSGGRAWWPWAAGAAAIAALSAVVVLRTARSRRPLPR